MLLALSLAGLAWLFLFRPALIHREAKQLKAAYAQSIPGAGSSGDAPFQGPDIAALQEQYPDLRGWLTIPGTGVDYPVMQSGGAQPEYYLRRSHTREWRTAGSLFFQADCTPESRNLVIYGHNMDDGTMFGDLAKMQDAAYRAEHSVVYLYTESGAAAYRIAAVLTADAETTVFNRTTFRDDADYMRFAAALLAGCGYAQQPADRLLTLVTCPTPYSRGSKRLLVVAVRQ